MRILVVEDEKRLADSLKALLASKGFSVETAYDGETGSEYAALGIYDLIIMDVMMPGLNGYELARQVRSGHSPVPILMLTAKGEVLDRIEGLNAGADYYLTKPFDNRELLACVHALLRRQGGAVLPEPGGGHLDPVAGAAWLHGGEFAQEPAPLDQPPALGLHITVKFLALPQRVAAGVESVPVFHPAPSSVYAVQRSASTASSSSGSPFPP